VELSGSKRTRALICLILALGTLGLYWQVHGFAFLNFDDPDYVTENPVVKQGLSFSGILWAFTHFFASNWHPLTWISHMLDVQIFGLNPAAPHVINVFLHAANAILLFLLLYRMTNAQWRSAIVAGLFAWHPLHVESVAWISERKDVLSTLFGLLSLHGYTSHVLRILRERLASGLPEPKGIKFTREYFLALIFFALSLMAKPMLVTLPLLMLLLDYWPLSRIAMVRTFIGPRFIKLAREKWPWFALAALSSVVTFFA